MKKCNEEIWSLNTGKMPHIRSNDIKLQSAQNTYFKATLPIIRLAHSLVSARENPVECKIDTEKALQECMDSLMLQAAAQLQLDNFRRDQFKAILPNDLRSLAADPNDGSKLLYGDNLDKRIQDINAQSKIKSSLATNGHSKSSYRCSGSRGNSHHLHKLEHQNFINLHKLQQLLPSPKMPRLGEASTQKEAGFIKKKNTLLEVSNANCKFNISVHILRQKLDQYVGGNISNHFAEWVNITKDTFVLDIVRSGLKIDFFKRPVCYNIKPSYLMSDTEKDTINSEIEKLLQKRIIVPTSYNKGDFVSSIFTRPRSDGS